jgi:hypothetical protein
VTTTFNIVHILLESPEEMKATGVHLLLLVTSAWSIAVHKRQSGVLGPLGQIAIQPNRVTEAESKLRTNSKRSIARYGPFTLPALDVSCATYSNNPIAKVETSL